MKLRSDSYLEKKNNLIKLIKLLLTAVEDEDENKYKILHVKKLFKLIIDNKYYINLLSKNSQKKCKKKNFKNSKSLMSTIRYKIDEFKNRKSSKNEINIDFNNFLFYFENKLNSI